MLVTASKIRGYTNELKGLCYGMRAERLMDKADKLHGKGKMERAQKTYMKAHYSLTKEADLSKKRLERVPSAGAENLIHQAKCLERTNNYKDAVSIYKHVVDNYSGVHDPASPPNRVIDVVYNSIKNPRDKLLACAMNGIEYELRFVVDLSKNNDSSSFLNEVKTELRDSTTGFQVTPSISNLIKIIDGHAGRAVGFANVALKYADENARDNHEKTIRHSFESASQTLGNLEGALAQATKPLTAAIENFGKPAQ